MFHGKEQKSYFSIIIISWQEHTNTELKRNKQLFSPVGLQPYRSCRARVSSGFVSHRTTCPRVEVVRRELVQSSIWSCELKVIFLRRSVLLHKKVKSRFSFQQQIKAMPPDLRWLIIYIFCFLFLFFYLVDLFISFLTEEVKVTRFGSLSCRISNFLSDNSTSS